MRVPRRQFLKRCGQTAAAALIHTPAGQSAAPDYHLHPHYREQTPLEPVLHKRDAIFDDFELEKEYDLIAAILAEWSNSLLQASPSTQAIARAFADGFSAVSLRPVATKTVRSRTALRVQQLEFATSPSLGAEAFQRELRSSLSDLSQLLTVELQVTEIAKGGDGSLRTQVRSELVGTGRNFFREQRSGTWNLEWTKSGGHTYRVQSWRQASETRSQSAAPFFEDVTDHALGHNASYNEQLVHGVDYWRTILDGASHIDIYGHNGVAVGDVHGSGFDDLYICQPAGLPNLLYRNRGDGTFQDVTAAAGVGVLENTACALFADFSNRGYQDLLIVRAEGPILFVNQGNGQFIPKPDAFQFAAPPQGTFTGAAAADYDRDGWLDIYFCLYVYYQGAGQYKYPAPYFDANNGPPNFLMRNNRDGTFRDETARAGLNQNNTRYSFCCGWTDVNQTDVNQDAWPDLYVVNDFGRKNLYRNNGDGTFTDIAEQAGVEDIGAGMSVCCFDYDNDGREDLYVADMWTAAGTRITGQDVFKAKSPPSIRSQYQKHAMGNSLFRNTGNARFEDRSTTAGVDIGRWSWSSDAWDFDHDGFQDLYVTNGMISGPLREDLNSFFWRQVVANSPDEPKPSPNYEQGWTAINELIRSDYSWSGYERNVFFANNGDGTFSDVSGAVGLDFLEDGRAFALADFDHDGRLEIVLKNRNGPQVRLLKNVANPLPPSISFQLRGTKSNRDAIGASITLVTEHSRQKRSVQAGSGFLSQHSKELLFGLGEARDSIRAEIRWPSGLLQTVDGLPPAHRILVEEGSQGFRAEPFRQYTAPIHAESQKADALPANIETWLLSPVKAPVIPGFDRKPALLHLTIGQPAPQLNANNPSFLAIDLAQPENADTAAVYNLLYRMLFDRHRDLTLPTSFLLNAKAEIVKVYQGPLDMDRVRKDMHDIPASAAERLAKALPFAGATNTFAYGRNYLSLGSVFFQRGYLSEAALYFQAALHDDPSSSEACYGLGSVFFKQSKLSDAQASFEQAATLTASYPETKPNAYNNLGLIAMQQAQPDRAIGYFEEALQLQPEYLIALQNLGNAYRSRKRYDDAQHTLERALAIAPDDPEVNYSLGMVFAQTDQPGRAYTRLQHALEMRPIYPEALNNLGVLYLRTQRRDEAVKAFQKCIQVAPAFDQSYLSLARVYLIEGNRGAARATLLALLRQTPNHPQAQSLLEQLK